MELGSGSSAKTRLLLDAYQKIDNSFRYIPTDISGGILKTSVLDLQEKYPALKKAYKQYQVIRKMCIAKEKEDENR